MEKTLLIVLALLALTNLFQGIEATSLKNKRIKIKRRLQLINKSPDKSFTVNGEILDCVEIKRQLAFDHPLLKNHSIQMKPSFKVFKRKTSMDNGGAKMLTPSQLLPKNIICPKGTVIVKRVLEKDLTMDKYSPFLGTMVYSGSNSSTQANPNYYSGHQLVANIQASRINTGASADINVWNPPEVKANQVSSAYVYVATSGDLSKVSAMRAGWAVNRYLYNDNKTRLYTHWTTDGGQFTGCMNLVCPGFVQVSQKTPLGLWLNPVSVYNGIQHFISLNIQKDDSMKNWWLRFGNEHIGYWPTELFTSLANEASRAVWGGEVVSPPTETTPGIGSGHFLGEGLKKACYIGGIDMQIVWGGGSFPSKEELQYMRTKSDCYNLNYGDGDRGQSLGRYILVGGPPNCKV